MVGMGHRVVGAAQRAVAVSVQWCLMGLQHHNPAAELRLVVGLHGPQDVLALSHLMELVRWGGAAARPRPRRARRLRCGHDAADGPDCGGHREERRA
ncbi:hypothetical protein ACP4OV_011577 [Aristida adscensionis]